MRNDEIVRIPQEGGELENLNSQVLMETEKTLFNYGCAMTARGLNKSELSILMFAKNGQMVAPLSEEKIRELVETAFIFALRDDVNNSLPTIAGSKRQLVPLLHEMYDSLSPDSTLFRHGGGLVSVRDGVIGHHTPDTVLTLLSRRANYVDVKQDGMFPPTRAANAILFASPGSDGDKIRPLERVVNVPVLRKDGTVFDSPGYDATSRIFYHPTGNIQKIGSNSRRQEAIDAAAWLLDMVGQFPFESEFDKTNYIGLLLTLVVRELCGCVPMALIDAPSAGTGKSLLAKIAHVVATGTLPEFGVLPSDEPEMRKAFTSRLQESPPILIYDNADEVIRSAVLAAVITSDVWQDRQLGRNRILHLPMRAALVVTGNNIRLGGDMPRRCYRIRLDANTAQPWTRGGFKHRLPEYATENRGEIIAALLTMAQVWIIAGHPKGNNVRIGSFESWCEVVGGILEYAGLNGFLGNLSKMYRDTADGEDDAEQWACWMGAIHAHWGDNGFTVKQLASAMNDLNAMGLRDAAPYSLGEIGAASDRAWLTRLGSALHGRKGQVFNLGEAQVKLCQGIVDSRMKQKTYWLAEK
ncbi:MAG: hypothetical protein LBS35_02205 [Synergistaceae bacterium]|nr:hypothetical protein [Synergistaceae bacterium]